MRRQRGLVGLMGLAALVGLALVARPAEAKITTEQSASILIFPKVIADGVRDTIISITNTSNNMRHLHCFYVNGTRLFPDGLDGIPGTCDDFSDAGNPQLWTEIDFDVWLTKQQPTHWVVSTGRLTNPLDLTCRAVNCTGLTSGSPLAHCCDAGFDPGRVPPTQPRFQGELKCVEVDASGFPVPGNALKGEATLVTLGTGDVSKYNAIGVKGFDTNNMDGTLCLGGDVTAECPTGAEYEACPRVWIMDHQADGAPNRVVEQVLGPPAPFPGAASSSVTSTLTVVPCTQNFETQDPEPITLQFIVANEFEQALSASTTVRCWAHLNFSPSLPNCPQSGISPIFAYGTIGGRVLKTTMRAVGNQRGVVAIFEESHRFQANPPARAAFNAHTGFDDVLGPDLITIPAEQLQDP